MEVFSCWCPELLAVEVEESIACSVALERNLPDHNFQLPFIGTWAVALFLCFAMTNGRC